MAAAVDLHIIFFPHMAPGHMIPMLDIARLFARRGVKATMLTTPGNAHLLQPAVDRETSSGHPLHLLVLPFSPTAVGLPEGCENSTSFPSHEQQMHFFFTLSRALQHPFDLVLREHVPDAVVTTFLYPWTAGAAHQLGIPRLIFHGHCFFAQCALNSFNRLIFQEPRLEESDSDIYVLPGLPHRIEMMKTQFPDMQGAKPDVMEMVAKMLEAESKTYGAVMNSFYEMEPEYADHYRKAMGKKAWHIGPVSLCNKDGVDKSTRGNKAAVDCHHCFSWLDSQKPCSIVYVCFGSLCNFTAPQLRQIALGLEASSRPFIWAVRSGGDDDGGWYEWLLEGLEEKGLIIKGWSPQLMILNHEAVGAFVMHCGWNSCLESISAGVPMITWPLIAEQFYNEKFVTEVLKVGVAVGSKNYGMKEEEWTLVKAEEVHRAVERVMDGGETEGMRTRAKELREKAKLAMEEGGSSYNDLGLLIQELKDKKLGVAA